MKRSKLKLLWEVLWYSLKFITSMALLSSDFEILMIPYLCLYILFWKTGILLIFRKTQSIQLNSIRGGIHILEDKYIEIRQKGIYSSLFWKQGENGKEKSYKTHKIKNGEILPFQYCFEFYPPLTFQFRSERLLQYSLQQPLACMVLRTAVEMTTDTTKTMLKTVFLWIA